MMPHFSNSTEVWRGFRDFGQVLSDVGSDLADTELQSIGSTMMEESKEIEKDLHIAIDRSTNKKVDPHFLANYAGGKEPWLWLDGRVYSTMMSSGVLNKEEVELVNKQQDRLLSLFRGWSEGGKGMLVFEDPRDDILWFTRGTPRPWLEDGKRIVVTDAPTKWGKIDYELNSEIKKGKIHGTIRFPHNTEMPVIKIKLRTPGKEVIRKFEVNGESGKDFDASLELITIKPQSNQSINFTVIY